VIALINSWFGASVVKFCSTTFLATGQLWLESLIALNQFGPFRLQTLPTQAPDHRLSAVAVALIIHSRVIQGRLAGKRSG
jgi:hypothetical protein